MATTASLTTTLRNMSGKTLSFGFIPPHGKRLAPNQEVTVNGDIRDYLRGNARKFKAFNDALVAGDIVIVDTPDQHFYDATLDVTKILKVDNGAVSVVDPSWGNYSSSIGIAH